MSADDLSQLSMQELFRIEVENQTRVLTAGLLALERDPGAADQLEACMRAAHSLKGVARIVDLSPGVGVAHGMEDCFVAAQQGRIRLGQRHIDLLLNGVDLLGHVAKTKECDRGQGGPKATRRKSTHSFLDCPSRCGPEGKPRRSMTTLAPRLHWTGRERWGRPQLAKPRIASCASRQRN